METRLQWMTNAMVGSKCASNHPIVSVVMTYALYARPLVRACVFSQYTERQKMSFGLIFSKVCAIGASSTN